MNKTQFYLSQCADAASKSPMCFTLGAVLVKGGKVISSGYNHHRPHYDGAEPHGHVPVLPQAARRARRRVPAVANTGRRPSLHAGGTPRTAFNGAPSAETDFPAAATAAAASHKRASASASPSPSRRRKPARREHDAAVVDDGGSGSGSRGVRAGKRRSRLLPERACCTAAGGAPAVVVEDEKTWSARRRDPRINGADIYVARVTKVGMGSAKPCWRCVEWCRWAGVKRIFHWNGEDGKFEMVKVNTAERDQYETHADIRLHAGMGW
ncbi:hypothetical protein BJV78DRAFT_1284368 [Lactifluus subvellereus]|nr:hypothetical protein BJV78DRAFT_1284368 [Lactifluus subvellereus]